MMGYQELLQGKLFDLHNSGDTILNSMPFALALAFDDEEFGLMIFQAWQQSPPRQGTAPSACDDEALPSLKNVCCRHCLSLFSSLPLFTRLPSLWISLRVKTGDNDNLLFQNTIVEAVWKTWKECAASLAMENRILFWVGMHRFQGAFYGREEFLSQAGALGFVPSVGIFNIRRGSR